MFISSIDKIKIYIILRKNYDVKVSKKLLRFCTSVAVNLTL